MTKPTTAAILAACAMWSMPVRCQTADLSANRLMPWCRVVVEKGPGPFSTADAQLAFDAGRCVGFVTGIAVAGSCLPPGVTGDQLLRVVMKYIDERPQRMHEDFAILVKEALAITWPCKR
jgi:hypothetical protein